MTKIILDFPCMGKTYLVSQNKKCLDLYIGGYETWY